MCQMSSSGGVRRLSAGSWQAREGLLARLLMCCLLGTVNSEKIALVQFLRFLRLASDAKLKFAMSSSGVRRLSAGSWQAREGLLAGLLMYCLLGTVNSENISLIFAFFSVKSRTLKLKFAMISAATLSV